MNKVRVFSEWLFTLIVTKGILLGMVLSIMNPVITSASEISLSFLDRKAEGWHWYEELSQPPKDEESKKDKEEAKVSLKNTEKNKKPLTPTEVMENIQKDLKNKLSLAILNPTVSNVRSYQEAQKAITDRSELFSQRWMEVVYTTPLLDYSIKHPTSQAARHIYLDERAKASQKMMRYLARTHGLFFFFKASCPYCHQFASIVKNFADAYGWKVMAISMDGSHLPEFPDVKPDNGIAQNLKVSTLPTLLAVNPDTKKVIPLSVGMTSQDQIEDRVRVLVKGGDLEVGFQKQNRVEGKYP